MLTKGKEAAGRASARPFDDLVPEAARLTSGQVQAARASACLALGPLLVAVAPIAESARRWLYLVALAALWLLIVRAVLRQSASRRWTPIAAGTGIALLGEASRMAFAATGNVVFLHGANSLRIAAYIVLIAGFLAIVRRQKSDNGHASVLDGAIVG